MFTETVGATGSVRNCLIFGRISKHVMTDTSLSCEAKALYGTFIIYGWKNNIAYPAIETLVRQLNIGKEKFRTILWELINQGYIKKGKMKSINFPNFQRNTYQIVACPPKYESEPKNERDIEAYEKIKADGIQSYAYGIVPQFVMADSKLSIEAKAIYLYLCAFAGNTNTAYPTEKAMRNALKMSENTYRKYLNELIKAGCVQVIHHRDFGKFSENEYELIGHPNASVGSNYNTNMAWKNKNETSKKSPSTKNPTIVHSFDNGTEPEKTSMPVPSKTPQNIDIIETANMNEVEINVNKSETPLVKQSILPPFQKPPYLKIPTIEEPSTEKPTTKTNNEKTNNFKTNTSTAPNRSANPISKKTNKKNTPKSVNQSAFTLNQQHANKKTSGLIDSPNYDKNFILQDLFERNAINPDFLTDQDTAKIIVNMLTSGMKPYTSEYWHRTIITALSQMLYSGGNPNDRRYNPFKVADLINAHIKTSSYDKSVSFDGWFQEFEKAFNKSVQRQSVSQNITYPIPYAKRSIWDFLVHYVSQNEKTGSPEKQSSFDIDAWFKKASDKAMNYGRAISNTDDSDEYIDFA